MTIAIVASGESAKDWWKTPHDLSIGVNDCLKHGHDVDQLVIVNFPRKFTPDRMKSILKSKAKVWTHTSAWRAHFPKAEIIRLSPFAGYVRKGHIYCSKTSPIVAISLAVIAGAKDIILWGCDYKSHANYRQGTKAGNHEISVYQKLFEGLNKIGVNVWLGAQGSALNLPLWTDIQEKKLLETLQK